MKPGSTPTPSVLAAVPLRKDVLSPLAPRNDEEGDKAKDTKEDDQKKKDEDKPDKKKDDDKSDKKADEAKADQQKEEASLTTEGREEGRGEETDDKKPDEKKKDEKAKPVEIDLAGFEERVVVLPPKAGRYDSLVAVSGKLTLSPHCRASARRMRSQPVIYYDLEKREEKTMLDDAD